MVQYCHIGKDQLLSFERIQYFHCKGSAIVIGKDPKEGFCYCIPPLSNCCCHLTRNVLLFLDRTCFCNLKELITIKRRESTWSAVVSWLMNVAGTDNGVCESDGSPARAANLRHKALLLTPGATLKITGPANRPSVPFTGDQPVGETDGHAPAESQREYAFPECRGVAAHEINQLGFACWHAHNSPLLSDSSGHFSPWDAADVINCRSSVRQIENRAGGLEETKIINHCPYFSDAWYSLRSGGPQCSKVNPSVSDHQRVLYLAITTCYLALVVSKMCNYSLTKNLGQVLLSF